MSTFPATEQLKIKGTPVFIHLACLQAVTWSAEQEAEYGPINDQGCDRCESSPDGRWNAVRVEL